MYPGSPLRPGPGAAGRLFSPLLVAGILFLAVSIPSPAAASGKPSIEPYGFVRLDAVVDDSRMQNHQYAMWVLSEDPLAGPENDARFTLYPG